MQERAEMNTDSLAMAFLDWEKAFDKINQQKMLNALKRLGINEKLITAIADLYSDPTFKVRGERGTSNKYPQRTGIRQGCPLSPY
eukprot:3302912-Lingulodinium_polyedra.AAC.1